MEEGFGKADSYDRVAADLRELLDSSDANFSDEGDRVKLREKVWQHPKELRGHEGGIEILRRYGNLREAAPSGLISRFKANSRSQGSLRTFIDLLNKDVWSSQGRFSSTPESFMDSDGELIMQRKKNPEHMPVSTGTVTRFKLFLDKEFIRPCKSCVDSCGPNWERGEDDVSKLCVLYSMPVYALVEVTKRRIFKNPHCALCNHVPVSELNCLHEFNLTKADSSIWNKAMLTQIEFTFGNVLAGHINCGMRSVWDPLFNRCYYLDAVEEMNGSTISPDPIYVSNTEVYFSITEEELKQTDPFNDEYNRREEDYCKETTLMTMSKVQWYLASAFFGVSIVCLGLHVVAYAYPRELVESSPRETGNTGHSSRTSLDCKQITGHSFIILSWLLLVGQLLFVVGVRRSEIRKVCLSIAILHNFFSLAAVSWLSVFCLQVFKSHFSLRSFKSMSSLESGSEAPPLKLSLIAWIIPTVFSSLCLTLELVPGDLRPCLARGGACWYGETVSFRIFFVLPALLMLAGDGCIFTAIVFGIREKKDRNISTSSRRKSNSHLGRRSSTITNHDHRCFRLCSRLGFVMTISWACAAAASLGNLPSLWYGFVIFSGIQGIYIFVASGTKSKLTNLIWAKATGQLGQMRRERGI